MSNPIPPHIDQLLIRFLAGEASSEERQQLEAWAAADPKNRQYLLDMKRLWQSSASAQEFAGIDARRDWQQVKARINRGSRSADTQPLYPARLRTYFWLKTAAAVVLLLGLLIGLYRQRVQPDSDDQIVVMATDRPRQLTLSDGTHVYLNKQARLTYPKQFTHQTREVTLTGEAFFDVAKNPAKPFLITSGSVVTRVVGTSFSVNAPTDDSIRVTVLTGKVTLSKRGKPGELLTLTPGEQGIYRNNKLTEAPNQDANFLTWKTGVLTFQNTPLSGVIQDLNRYYNRNVEIAGKSLENCRLTSTFQQQSLNEVLSEIQLVLPIQVQQKNNRIILTGEGCR